MTLVPPTAQLRWKRLFGPYLAWAFRVALGVIFVVAALPKIARPDLFAWSIANYHLLPDDQVNLLAICLPWIEIVCGLALILGLAIRANLLAIEAMLLVFIVAISSAMARNLDISCGCFSPGPAAASMTRQTLIWDIVWFAMGMHAMIFDRSVLAVTKTVQRLRKH